MIHVNIIGSGNVGQHLSKAFYNCDNVTINQWVIRNEKSVINLNTDIPIVNSISELTNADITFLAVPDDVIANLSDEIPFNDQLVVHTSGSVNIHDLASKNRRGVFYPLQSFSKDAEIDFSEVPICIEALAKSDLAILKNVAEAIGATSYKIYTEQRQMLHLAAVYVNNFSNQLYRIAHELIDSKNISFDLLKPLIKETARKIEDLTPYMAQTGPAKRNDKKTIKRHLKQLEDKHHKEIYELLTKSIIKTHGKKL